MSKSTFYQKVSYETPKVVAFTIRPSSQIMAISGDGTPDLIQQDEDWD